MSDELLGETLELVDSLKRELAAAQQRIAYLASLCEIVRLICMDETVHHVPGYKVAECFQEAITKRLSNKSVQAVHQSKTEGERIDPGSETLHSNSGESEKGAEPGTVQAASAGLCEATSNAPSGYVSEGGQTKDVVSSDPPECRSIVEDTEGFFVQRLRQIRWTNERTPSQLLEAVRGRVALRSMSWEEASSVLKLSEPSELSAKLAEMEKERDMFRRMVMGDNEGVLLLSDLTEEVQDMRKERDNLRAKVKELLSRVTWFVSFTDGQLHHGLYQTILQEIAHSGSEP